jgi:hypothetical protein
MLSQKFQRTRLLSSSAAKVFYVMPGGAQMQLFSSFPRIAVASFNSIRFCRPLGADFS